MLYNIKLTVSPTETPVQLVSRMLSKNKAYEVYSNICTHLS